jgi:predicted phosphodiesterase
MRGAMNDYQFIYTERGNLQPEDVTAMFTKNALYIKKQIARAKRQGLKMVLLTHHKPYAGENYDVKSYDVAYESPLNKILKAPVAMCAYGHTHQKDDRLLNGVRMFSNPKGYPKQKTGFKKGLRVSI